MFTTLKHTGAVPSTSIRPSRRRAVRYFGNSQVIQSFIKPMKIFKMEWYNLAVIPVIIFGFWMYTSQMTRSFPTLTGKRIVLLIAHPDDEAMFFAPALLSLSRPELGNHIKILCLSTGTSGQTLGMSIAKKSSIGDSEGLGEIRRKELMMSGLSLGLRSSEDILVLDDKYFH